MSSFLSEFAKPYAQALIELGEEQGNLDELGEELQGLYELTQSEENFQTFLEAPHISSQEKKDLLKKVFEKKLSENCLKFLYLLADRGKFVILPDIAIEFQKLLDESLDRIRALATTTQEIDNGLSKKISDALKKATGKEVVLENKVDEAILGGIILNFDGTQVDGSLRQRLENWKRELLKKKVQI